MNAFSYAFVSFRNSAAQTVNQRLVFVGSEEGKILALRQIFNEVITFLFSLCLVWPTGTAFPKFIIGSFDIAPTHVHTNVV